MNNERLRPVIGGISSGNLISGATGTVGLPVYDAQTGELLILSNWHVFESSGDILQPGSADGGGYLDRVAIVTRSLPLSSDRESKIDAAIAKPLNGDLIQQSILDIGIPVGATLAEVGMTVFKSGRTTQLTQGVITDINAALDIGYRDVGTVSLEDLIFFKGEDPIVKGGDSGSALVTYIDGKPYVVGLVFAGPANSPYNYGVACKIENIMNELGIVVSMDTNGFEEKPVVLTGAILDVETQVQIPNARVSAGGIVVYTDCTGQYTIGLDEPGMYTIVVSAKGYNGGQIEVDLNLGDNHISIGLHQKGGLTPMEFLPITVGLTASIIAISKVVTGGEGD